MNAKRMFLAAILPMTLIAISALAQDKPQAPSPASAESAAKESVERLSFLFGSWELTAKYDKSALLPNGGEAHGRYAAKAGPGGFYTIADFHWTDGPEGEISGHEIITWDGAANTYSRYVFGNGFSLPYISAGHWEGKTLVFDGDFDFETTKYHFRESITPSPSGTVTLTESYRTGDSPLQPMLTTSMKKSPAAKADANVRTAATLLPELQKLSFPLGNWHYVQTYEKTPMTPDGGTGEGSYRAAAGPGGESIITEFEESSGKMAGISAHEVFAWDAGRKAYVGYAFVSNSPGCFLRGGTWEGGQLIFTREIIAGPNTIHMRFVYTEAKSDSVVVQTSMAVGDAPLALAMTTKASR